VGEGHAADLKTLINLSKMLPGSGRCHLIDGAATVLQSSLNHFYLEYQQTLVK